MQVCRNSLKILGAHKNVVRRHYTAYIQMMTEHDCKVAHCLTLYLFLVQIVKGQHQMLFLTGPRFYGGPVGQTLVETDIRYRIRHFGKQPLKHIITIDHARWGLSEHAVRLLHHFPNIRTPTTIAHAYQGDRGRSYKFQKRLLLLPILNSTSWLVGRFGLAAL